MNNYISLEAIMEQQRQRLVENVCSVTDEAYIIFRHRNSADIEVANCPRVFFTPEISYYDNNTLEASVTIQLGTDDEVKEGCKNLYNEHFKIREYEEQLKKIKEELAEVKRQRNRKWFETIYMITSKTMYSDYQSVEDSNDTDLFLMWQDFNCKDKPIVFYTKLPYSFISTNYFKKLFEPNMEVSDFNQEQGLFIANTPNVGHDGYGCNHWCILVNKKAFWQSRDKLKYYPNDEQVLLRCNDISYMQERLNEIWKHTFGEEYREENN